MINLFEYQDFRLYLKEYYNTQKSEKKYFSYRYFAQKAGINASAFLYYVIEGKRNLTKTSINKISLAIGHSREENEYFENLVFFNQAKTISDKTMFYSRVIESRKTIDMKVIEKDRYDYYSQWYHSIVREVATFLDFKDNFKLLGETLVPKITAQEAMESIELLEKLGFIERDGNGVYHQTDNVIAVKPMAQEALVIEKFQMEMLLLARASYDAFPRADRMSASTSFSISKETFDLFTLKTREFRKELLEIARLDTQADRAYQFTFNLFPVSRRHHEK